MYPHLELSAFLHKASACKTYTQLRSAVLESGNVVPSLVWGWTRFARQLDIDDIAGIDIGGKSAPDRFFARYKDGGGLAVDRLMPVVIARHIAVHNLQVSPDWERDPYHLDFLAPFGWKHTMTAPVVRDGGLAATLHFVRGPRDKPFAHEDLLTAFAMANHVSALLTRIDGDEQTDNLTERELEIGRLVAAGLNNTEIASCLGVSRNTVKGALKRVFRKLDVDSRAEMAVRLSAARLL